MKKPKERRLSKEKLNTVVTKYKRLVWKLALAKARTDDDLDALLSYGFEGLIQAARRFDKSKNVKFITFAYRCVWGFIGGAVRSRAIVRKHKEKICKCPVKDVIDCRKPAKRSIEQKEVWAVLKGCVDEREYAMLYDCFVNGLSFPEMSCKYRISKQRVDQI